MKKIYTSLASLAIICPIYLSAASPASFVERTADVADSFTAMKPLSATQTARASVSGPAKVAVEHDWQPFGTAEFTDDIIPAMFQVQTATYNLVAEQDALNPGYYRLLDPYGPESYFGERLSKFTTPGYTGTGRALVIDATDPRNVIIEPSPLGISMDGEELFIESYSYLEKIGEVPEGFVSENNLQGINKEGIITFPTPGSLWVSTPSLDMQGKGYRANPNGALRIKLPGAKDYTLELLTASWCSDDDGNVIISPWGGADVAYVKAGLVADPTDKQAISAILTSDQRLESRKGTVLKIDGEFGPNEVYYVIGVSFDAAGNMRESDMHMVYTPDLSGTWFTMPAKARFTDYIVSNIYTDIDLGTYEVDVQESSETPGRYRLVNPYAAAPYNMWEYGLHGNHDHYLYLDASDPECVILEESPIGMILNPDGDMRVTSDAYICYAQGLPKDAIAHSGLAGRMVDGVITFPSTCKIYAGFHTEGMDSWYFANYKRDENGNVIDGDLRIDLKDAISAGVDGIGADAADTTPRYYNLQGIEVDASARGILVKVCGKDASLIRK